MEQGFMELAGFQIPVYRVRTAVIGSGCAGLNAADWLYDLGERDIAIVTEGLGMGTSRNTGSDKQTYYKLSLTADEADSAGELAKTLLAPGVHGDTALIEAACSAQSFFKLAQLGVPFPTNAYGEFVGYRTDHDPRQRATSAGPLTSKYMVEALERQVRAKQIPILAPMVAFQLLKGPDGALCGVLCYVPREGEGESGGFALICCAHAILATGGPAHLYEASVYPTCHTGMTGMALQAGASGANLHQWQYGLASTQFRWNVSGSYQQVLPRYVSVDTAGNAREFLPESFEDPMEAVRLTFLKGYEWPFDTKKVHGSSVIDLLVHRETSAGRRVFLDFRSNPAYLDAGFTGLSDVAVDYLKRSSATQATPIERLRAMNPLAIDLYAAHGIDLATEMLEIDVCAQHHNGGLAVDKHWRTTVKGLYAAGEAAGTFGAYRPGGSALNATQVGSMRAAQHIAWDSMAEAMTPVDFKAAVADKVRAAVESISSATLSQAELLQRREGARCAMTRYAAHVRDIGAMRGMLAELPQWTAQSLLGDTQGVRASCAAMLKYRDQLITEQAVLDAMLAAAEETGSTGAGLVRDDAGLPVGNALPGEKYRPAQNMEESRVLYTDLGADGRFASQFAPVRPMPERDTWFERVWREDRARRGKRKHP